MTRPYYAWYHPISLLLTCGMGHMPFAPGTWGSMVAFPLAFIAFFFFGKIGYVLMAAMIVGLFVAGCWAATRYMEKNGKEDPGEIVVDEVIGQLITLLMAAPYIGSIPHGTPYGALLLFLCFILFRIFDIVKPWPVSWADQKIEGGLGVMLDDVFAGIYAGIAFYVAVKVMIVIGIS